MIVRSQVLKRPVMILKALFLLCAVIPRTSARRNMPHILWWYSLGQGDEGWTRSCGPVDCLFGADREAWRNGSADMLLFYGTDLNSSDLPLPRRADHLWALLHEESPVNNPMLFHREVTRLFNLTATFHRHSDFSLLGQEVRGLDWLTTKRLVVPIAAKNRLIKEEGLAPVVYLQSNCHAASDRDALVRQLMKWVPVDSYGKCLHNKDLPPDIAPDFHSDETTYPHRLYSFLARYKFVLAFENYRCDDYLTEKFWRPFHIGSVPIVLSTPAAKDLAPDNHSAIFVDDFTHVQDLAKHILYLNSNDSAYAEYLAFKRRGAAGVQSSVLRRLQEFRAKFADEHEVALGSFEVFECFLCSRLHQHMLQPQSRASSYAATCPRPMAFARDGRIAWDGLFPPTYPDHTLAFELGWRQAAVFRERAAVTPDDVPAGRRIEL